MRDHMQYYGISRLLQNRLFSHYAKSSLAVVRLIILLMLLLLMVPSISVTVPTQDSLGNLIGFQPIEASAITDTHTSISIKTSADSHEGKFFGESLVQVIITDEDNTSTSLDDSITVRIEAKAENHAEAASTFIIPNTSAGSQKFEFFLVHSASQYVDGINDANGKALDTRNIDGVDIPSDGFNGTGAPVIRFGSNEGTGIELPTNTDLFEPVSFTISYADEPDEIILYEESFGQIQIDRTSYGTDSFVYITIEDQDANLNPVDSDEFLVDSSTIPNQDLLGLDGGMFLPGEIIFKETGDNTGLFKGKYALGSSIQVESESISLILHEKANYDATLDADENDSNETDEVSFTVGNSSGIIQDGGDHPSTSIITWDPIITASKSVYGLNDKVNITIIDKDANRDLNAIDPIGLEVQVNNDNRSKPKVLAYETGKNTGIFEGILQLFPENKADETNSSLIPALVVKPGDNITIMYSDLHPADYSKRVANGNSPEKTFLLNIHTNEKRTGINSLTIMAPTIHGVNGSHDGQNVNVYNARVGSKIRISTEVTNNNADEESKPFIGIIEVRDSNDVTTFLSWESTSVKSNSSSIIEFSWEPLGRGTYSARTFAISQLTDGEILSPIAISKINVN